MAALELAIETEFQRYQYSVTLDGVVFQLVWVWSERAQQWFVDLLDSDGNAIRSGLAVVTGFPLFSLLAESSRPLGEMVITQVSSPKREPAETDLGDSHAIVYLDADELAGLSS